MHSYILCTSNKGQHLITSVEPVKATLSTFICFAIAAPAVGPKPGMTLITPGGKPACYTSKKQKLLMWSFGLKILLLV